MAIAETFKDWLGVQKSQVEAKWSDLLDHQFTFRSLGWNAAQSKLSWSTVTVGVPLVPVNGTMHVEYTPSWVAGFLERHKTAGINKLSLYFFKNYDQGDNTTSGTSLSKGKDLQELNGIDDPIYLQETD